MHRVLTKTTYLEMSAPPGNDPPAPPASTRIERLQSPSMAEYRFLYNGVGAAFQWVDRNLMPDDVLLRIIGDEAVEIHVLHVDGRPAGFVEFDRRTPGQVELAYFGLFPDFIGKGLGKYFLSWAVAKAWSFAPRRVWVHTCDLDHEAALPNYLQAGFSTYDERLLEQVVP